MNSVYQCCLPGMSCLVCCLPPPVCPFAQQCRCSIIRHPLHHPPSHPLNELDPFSSSYTDNRFPSSYLYPFSSMYCPRFLYLPVFIQATCTHSLPCIVPDFFVYLFFFFSQARCSHSPHLVLPFSMSLLVFYASRNPNSKESAYTRFSLIFMYLSLRLFECQC